MTIFQRLRSRQFVIRHNVGDQQFIAVDAQDVKLAVRGISHAILPGAQRAAAELERLLGDEHAVIFCLDVRRVSRRVDQSDDDVEVVWIVNCRRVAQLRGRAHATEKIAFGHDLLQVRCSHDCRAGRALANSRR